MQVVPLFIDAIHIIPHTTVRQILVSAAWHVGCVFFSFAFFTGLLTGQPAQTQPSGMGPAGPNPICPWQLRMAWANLAPPGKQAQSNQDPPSELSDAASEGGLTETQSEKKVCSGSFELQGFHHTLLEVR